MSKILTFRICAEGFSRIKNGIIENRFREATPYWQSRLLDEKGNFKKFDEIHIINGYSKDSPQAIVEFDKIVQSVNEERVAGFEIRLGKVKEIIE